MAKMWNRLSSRRDNNDYWQHYNEEPDYGWLKKTVVALFLFVIVYMAHISGTVVGRTVDEGIRYMVSAETDWNYVLLRITEHAPKELDLSLLKRVQTTMSKPADPLMYMTKPVGGKITVNYGWQMHPVLKQETLHEGIDLEAPLGTNVQASAPGKVKAVTESARYGKMVILEHSREIETVYGHLGEVLVKPGDAISQGQVIAKSGKSGMTNGPVLYFEVRENGTAIDPLTRMKGDVSFPERK